jgi:Ala-tRNA(Pro) deacylase
MPKDARLCNRRTAAVLNGGRQSRYQRGRTPNVHWLTRMPATPADLFAFLDRLGIAHCTVTHPPLFTVEEARALRGQIAGGHTKNLFLSDAVTPFAAINDAAARVTVILDAAMMAHATLNYHPLRNTMTTSIARDDLVKFLAATGHPPRIMAVAGAALRPEP